MGAKVWSGFHSHKCYKKAKVERNGLFFCGIHDPVARAAKKEKRDAEWKDKFDADARKDRIRSAAPELLAALIAMVDEAQPAGITRPAYKGALTAIAKATGDAS